MMAPSVITVEPALLVSVVVPTYKRPKLLARCLASLTSQTLDPSRYEIIVADDGPTDETQAVVTSWSDRQPRPRMRYLQVSGQHGPAAARNQAWHLASASIIAFTDDDCLPAPDWLSNGLAALGPEIDGVAGRIIVPLPSTPTDYERSVAGLETAEFATANCVYRKTALARVGGFDERFTKAWREDADLFFSLLEAGCGLAQAPDAVVVHPVRPARWGISLRLQKNSLFNALLYRKHPSLYRRRIASGPPRQYYPSVFVLILAMGSAAAGRTWLASVAAGMWTWLTIQFIRRRLCGTSHHPRHIAEMIITSPLIPPLAVMWRLWGAVKYRVAFR